MEKFSTEDEREDAKKEIVEQTIHQKALEKALEMATTMRDTSKKGIHIHIYVAILTYKRNFNKIMFQCL